jgi:prepilin signal peptidase PulO-like enzyme (type II secretory pathway)
MGFYVAAGAAGAMTGILARAVTVRAIGRRTEAPPKTKIVFGDNAPLLWALLSAAAWLWAYAAYGMSVGGLELLFVLAVVSVLSAVDWAIRSIPNRALWLLAAGAVASMALRGAWGGIAHRLGGAALCLCVFGVPLLMGKQAGMGDVKYAAVMGFYLGAAHALVAMALMSAVLLLQTLLLAVAGKGGLRSFVAMGPAMSVGFVLSLAFAGGVRI